MITMIQVFHFDDEVTLVCKELGRAIPVRKFADQCYAWIKKEHQVFIFRKSVVIINKLQLVVNR
jgi:hypothetical protein